jgi:thiol-disulfide isomerase/thioredoxin
MNRKLLLLLVSGTMLACNFLFPSGSTATPQVNNPTTNQPIEEASADPELPTIDPDLPAMTLVRLHPEAGDLPSMLYEEAQKATAMGRIPVVEFDATWCPPCQAIEEAFNEKNELMLDAYAGTYIIKLDVDEWGWGGSQLHDFEFDGIPVYFILDAEGNRTGRVIDANAWGENIPENMAPPMDEFFHGEE